MFMPKIIEGLLDTAEKVGMKTSAAFTPPVTHQLKEFRTMSQAANVEQWSKFNRRDFMKIAAVMAGTLVGISALLEACDSVEVDPTVQAADNAVATAHAGATKEALKAIFTQGEFGAPNQLLVDGFLEANKELGITRAKYITAFSIKTEGAEFDAISVPKVVSIETDEVVELDQLWVWDGKKSGWEKLIKFNTDETGNLVTTDVLVADQQVKRPLVSWRQAVKDEGGTTDFQDVFSYVEYSAEDWENMTWVQRQEVEVLFKPLAGYEELIPGFKRDRGDAIVADNLPDAERKGLMSLVPVEYSETGLTREQIETLKTAGVQIENGVVKIPAVDGFIDLTGDEIGTIQITDSEIVAKEVLIFTKNEDGQWESAEALKYSLAATPEEAANNPVPWEVVEKGVMSQVSRLKGKSFPETVVTGQDVLLLRGKGDYKDNRDLVWDKKASELFEDQEKQPFRATGYFTTVYNEGHTNAQPISGIVHQWLNSDGSTVNITNIYYFNFDQLDWNYVQFSGFYMGTSYNPPFTTIGKDPIVNRLIEEWAEKDEVPKELEGKVLVGQIMKPVVTWPQ